MTTQGVACNAFSLLGRWDPIGPIFRKELILAARRRRSYVLRSLYVACLMVILAYSWTTFGMFRAGTANRIATMSDLGVGMVITLGGFQFFALQLIAPAMAGAAISEEVRRQTLACLLMTPISSLQIVVGKLFSRMLLVLFLVATTFPLLAILRVFGGVEWSLILSLEGLTFFSALFAAALSLTFSTLLRKQARDPAALTYVALLTIYLLIPMALTALDDFRPSARYFAYFNPYFSMTRVIANAFRPGMGSNIAVSSPPIQCALLLLATIVLVVMCSLFVRRLSLRIAAGEPIIRLSQAIHPTAVEASGPRAILSGRSALSYLLAWSADRPVLWRALLQKYSGSPLRRHLTFFIFLAVIIGSYFYAGRALNERETHIVYVEVFFLLLLARTAAVSAAAVTHEKESNTLELLFTTPIKPRQILRDKLLAGLPELLTLGLFFLLHLGIFLFDGVLPWDNVLLLLIILAGPLYFLLGTGAYFSAKCKTTRGAVSGNQVLGLILWLPCFPWNSFMLMRRESCPINPFLAAVECLSGGFTGGRSYSSHIDQFWLGAIVVSFIYAILGVVFSELAVRKLGSYSSERARS